MVFGHNSGNLNNAHACAYGIGEVCYPNAKDTPIYPDTWYTIEAYVVSSTCITCRNATVKWWVNGELNDNNRQWPSSGFCVKVEGSVEITNNDRSSLDRKLGIFRQQFPLLVANIQEKGQLLNNGRDTLNLLHDINSGMRSGLDVIRIINPKFNPGVYGDLKDPSNVLRALRDLYGQTPKSPDSELIEAQDQSVAEVISMNRNLYDYADQVDQERERILVHSEVVSPQGAAKLQNQSLAVLIGVMTQLLRSQSQMLKIMAQNMALQNRKEKITSQQFLDKFQGVSEGLGSLPQDVTLPQIQSEGGK